jgi:hypothetical protein
MRIAGCTLEGIVGGWWDAMMRRENAWRSESSKGARSSELGSGMINE